MSIILQTYFKPHARPAPHLTWEMVDYPFATIEEVAKAMDDGEFITASSLRSSPGFNTQTRRIDMRFTIVVRGAAVDRLQVPPFIFIEGRD